MIENSFLLLYCVYQHLDLSLFIIVVKMYILFPKHNEAILIHYKIFLSQ